MSHPTTTTVPKAAADGFRLHPLLETIPGWENTDDFRALVEDVREHGIRQPVVCTPDLEIIDGKHRWLAARECGAEVPFTVSTEAPQSVIVYSLLERRHCTKGARAYLVWPLIAPTVESNKQARLGNLKKGAETRKDTECLFGESIEKAAARLGFGGTLLKQARDVHALLAKAPHRREEIELAIFVEEVGLGAFLAGEAGKAATAGQRRVDAPLLELLTRGFRDLRNRFKPQLWDGLPETEKTKAADLAVECVLGWPDDVRSTLVKALNN